MLLAFKILFLMVLDCVMKRVSNRPWGLQWELIDGLEDINFSDNLCLMSQTLGI